MPHPLCPPSSSPRGQEIVQNVLETICFVPDTANRYDEYLHDPVESQAAYTMPDGMVLDIGFERFNPTFSLRRSVEIPSCWTLPYTK